jgi:hypothetical protein
LTVLKAIIAVALVAAPAAILAQGAPDINDATVQGQQINDAVTRATRTRVQKSDNAGDTIDGEAGVFVLRVNEIFAVSASGGIGYTDNPARTADNPGSSFYGDFGVSAGIATVLGEKVDFGLSASVGGREFFKSFAPSNRTASGNISLGTAIGRTPLYIGVVGFGGFSFDRNFKGGTSFYGASGSLSASLPLSKAVLLRPGVGVTRQWSGVRENNSTSYSGSLELLAALSPKLTVSLRGAVTRRVYDDFYENVTFVKRLDTQFQIGAVMAFRPVRNLTFAINAGYEKQNSRFFLSEYDALDGGLAVSVRYQF